MNAHIFLPLLLGGCLQSSSSSGTFSSSPSQPPFGGSSSAKECTEGVPSTIVNAQVEVMQQTGDSYHEMVACGGLAYRISSSIYQILATSLLESAGVSVPGGFVYEGEGRYVTGSGGTTMVVSYLYGDDFEVGLEDEPVLYDLFDFDNYLRGVSVSVDPISQELLVSYNATGPLVELLGKGANPPNPLSLTLQDVQAPYRLGRLKMVTEAQVNDVREGATVSYTLSSGPDRINPLLEGNRALVFGLAGSTTIAANGAVLTATSVGIDYQDTPGALDGDIPFEIRGGGLDLDGVLSFQQSTYPEIAWWCPE